MSSNGTNLLLRNSERTTFKRCRQQWHWSFNDLLKPVETAPALKFGDLVHQALALYYKPGIKRGPVPSETFYKLFNKQYSSEYAEGFRDEDGDWHEAGHLGVSMLERYVELYGVEDEQYRVLSSEQIFFVPLKVEIPGHGLVRFRFVGTLDGVWQNRRNKDVFFAEHKTTKAIATDALQMDEQAGSYWTYAPKWLRRQGILKPSQMPTHILYNFLRKWAPDPAYRYDALGRKLNKDGSVSKQQAAPAFKRWPVYRDLADRVNMHQRVLDEFTDMYLIRAGERAYYKNPGPLFMPNCRGCPFRDPCELHETGNDYQSMFDAAYVTWQPYAAHELPERF